ncbi:MAG: PaaI family thioesterase [Betaproteobacteria bacterium]|nr:PaaI family thioesterase [Betaproteobacteria bacterium]
MTATTIAATTAVPEGYTLLKLPRSGYGILWSERFYGNRADGKLVIGMRVQPDDMNSAGGCHGAVVLAFCDTLMSLGTNIQAGLLSYMTTVNLTCDFISPAPLGSWMEGRLEVLRATRSLAFSQGTLMAEGKLIARMNAILKLQKEPNPGLTPDSFFT